MVKQAGFLITDIAKENGVAVHVVRYIVESNDIEPAYRLGYYPLFSEESAQRIKSILAQRAERKARRAGNQTDSAPAAVAA